MFKKTASSFALAMVGVSLLSSSCGVIEGKKKKAKGSKEPGVEITESRNLGGRKFLITYKSDQNNATFKCSTDSLKDAARLNNSKDANAGWIDCPEAGYQYELPAGISSEAFSVKAVVNGLTSSKAASTILTSTENINGGQALGSKGAPVRNAAVILEKGRVPKTLSNGKLRLSFGLKSGSAEGIKFECKDSKALSFGPCSESNAHTIQNLKRGDQVNFYVRPVSLSSQEVGDIDSIGLRVDGSGSAVTIEEIPALAAQAGSGSYTSSPSDQYSSVKTFGNPLLIGSYQFRVAADMDVKSYATYLTNGAKLNTYMLAENGMSCQGGLTQRTIDGQRILPYCEYVHNSSPEAMAFLRSEGLTPNSLVVQTQSGSVLDGAFEQIQISFFRDQQEHSFYTHAYEFYCGLQTGDQSSAGIIPNVPLVNTYWHGELPRQVNFRYCTRAMVVDTQTVNVIVGTFQDQRQFPCSPYGDNIEMIYIATINQSNFNPSMFAKKAQERILPSLSPAATVLNATRQ